MKPENQSTVAVQSDQKERVCAALIAKLADFLRTQGEVINPLHPLAEYGIDSTDLLMLMFEIEDQFGCKFPPSTFFDIETVDDLADRITASLTKQGIFVPEAARDLAR
jgi:acyl carrier protein